MQYKYLGHDHFKSKKTRYCNNYKSFQNTDYYGSSVDRKQDLRELKLLQKQENKQYQDLVYKNNVATDTQERKFDMDMQVLVHNSFTYIILSFIQLFSFEWFFYYIILSRFLNLISYFYTIYISPFILYVLIHRIFTVSMPL